jgi:glycoprotein endo-alpha-1,2-mannosidase
LPCDDYFQTLMLPSFRQDMNLETPHRSRDPEEDWVVFSDSPFSSDSKICDGNKKKASEMITQTSSYQRHIASIEMIYGAPHVLGHQENQTEILNETPHPEQSSSIDEEKSSLSIATAKDVSTTSSNQVHLPRFNLRNQYIKDTDDGKFPSWDQTDQSDSWDLTEKDRVSRRNKNDLPLLNRIGYSCCLRWSCILALLFILPVIGLIFGSLIRGESLTAENIFSIRPRQNPPTISPAPTISLSPSDMPTMAPTFLGPPPSNITVGAYYYPWYGSDFHGGQGYLRRELNQLPFLGEYNDTDPGIIAKHLSWSRYANIRLWVTSWWGQSRIEDSTTKNIILNHRDLGDHQIALLYETNGRIREANNFSTVNVEEDIEYICKSYFDHPNYYRIGDRPVLFVYLTRKMEQIGNIEEVILLMRSVADFWGHNIYIVGDHAFGSPPPQSKDETFLPFLYLDAVTNYDVYGSMSAREYAGSDTVEAYYKNQRMWRGEAHLKKCGFIPTVSPGYNDRGVRLEADHAPVSRKLSPESPEGSLLKLSIKLAKYLVDETVDNLLMVNSFNEWHEDTQIEPVIGADSNSPYDYTMGLEYIGYGELYLDILRQGTADILGENDSVNEKPTPSN